MRYFQNSRGTLRSGVDHVFSKWDFSALGIKCIKIFLISPCELKEENDLFHWYFWKILDTKCVQVNV